MSVGAHVAVEVLGWLATVTFVASYFFARPGVLVRVQMIGGALWILYGALMHAMPVVAANALVILAAAWKILQGPRGGLTRTEG